jgi:hypothetical protein
MLKFFATEVRTGCVLASVSEVRAESDPHQAFWICVGHARTLTAFRHSEAMIWRQLDSGPPENVAHVEGWTDLWIAEEFTPKSAARDEGGMTGTRGHPFRNTRAPPTVRGT